MRDGQFADAAAVLKEILEDRPDDSRLQHLYGMALLRNEQASLAVWPLRRAARDPALGLQAGIDLCEALLRGGATLEAAAEADKLLQQDPENERLRMLRARANLAALLQEEALEDFDWLLERYPEELRILQLKFGALMRLESTAEARQVLENMALLVSSGDHTPAVRGNFCISEAGFEANNGDAELAETLFAACAEAFPTQAAVQARVATFFEEQGDADRAATLLREAADAAPSQLPLQILLASKLRNLGEVAEAEERLRETAETLGTPVAWTRLADLLLALDDLPGAREAIDRALSLRTGQDPDAPDFPYASVPEDGLFAYADVLVQLGEHERVEEILAHIQEPVYRLLIEARTKAELGEPEAALALWDEAFLIWPSNAGARYLAGRVAIEAGDYERAASLLQDSLRAAPEATDAGLLLARMQQAQGRSAAALETLSHYLLGHKNDPTALRMLTGIAIQLGRSEMGQAARGALASLADWTGVAMADHAQDAWRALGAEVALEFLDTNAQLDDANQAAALAVWAEIQIAEGRGIEALERVEHVLNEEPESAGLQEAWGRTLHLSGDLEASERALRRALELDSRSATAAIALAELLAETQRIDEALTFYDAAERVDPQNPAPGYDAALALLAAGREQEAAERLETLLEAHPWHGNAAHEFVRIALQRGEGAAPRTLALARRAVEFRSHARGESLATLARVQRAHGDAASAVANLGLAVEFGEQTPRVYYDLGRAREELGELEAARAAYTRALEGGEFAEAEAARKRLGSSVPGPAGSKTD
ncbi:MAG: tetratricopeptide repeat protein [Myxococcales bacterium]|nr:tetratricopeptide repeat protein [Myxococcales bacterium]